jgi:hypothetical protein
VGENLNTAKKNKGLFISREVNSETDAENTTVHVT